MPILDASDYSPQFVFRCGHTNTIYSAIFRKGRQIVYERKRFYTSDNDFVDLDFLYSSEHKKLAVLCHGLEGNSNSQYMQHTASLLHNNKWNVLCFNYRACSGEMNRQLQMYHSGWTTDLHEIIDAFKSNYDKIALVGFSLGANMILKYANDGIYPISKKIESIVSISNPCDLRNASHKIIHWSNKIYDKRFIQTLKAKMVEKHRLFPDIIPIKHLSKLKNLMDFDEYFTAPLNGFASAEDYYSKCSSKQFLCNTSIPTLMITAQDDPFFVRECLPFKEASAIKDLYFLAPKFGGHVGFTTFGANYYWNEQKTLQFIDAPYDFVNHHRVINR